MVLQVTPLVVCAAGLVLYWVAPPRWSMVGLVMFAAALVALLLHSR